MDEFAVRALRWNLEKLQSWVFQPWKIHIKNPNDLKWFDEIIKNRSLVDKILWR